MAADPESGSAGGRLPTAVALGLLLALPLFLFRPALWSGKMIYGYDFLATHLPFWLETQRSLAAHCWPLWMPDLMGGMPGIAACNLIFIYPSHLLAQLAGLPFAQEIAWNAALHVALAGAGMFLFLRRLERSVGAAMLGALCFEVSGSEISQLYGGYIIYVEAIALVPWAFWAAHKGWREGSWFAWGLCGLAFGLQILAGAAQLFAYTAAAVALFALAQPAAEPGALPVRGRLPVLQGLALALGLAFLLSAPQLWLTLQYLPLAERNGYSLADFVDGSISLRETLTWLVPGFFGWQSPHYDGVMGDCFTSEYMGLLPWGLAAAALAALWRRERRVRWMAGLALTALFLAQRHWTPFYYLFRSLPVLRGFRIWSRILFLVTFAVCSLAAYGWDALAAAALRRRALAGASVFIALAAVAAGLAWALAGHRGLADAQALHGLSLGLDPHVETAYISGGARDSARVTLLLLLPLPALLWLGSRRRLVWLALPLALAFHLRDQSGMLNRFVYYLDPAMAAPQAGFAGAPLPPLQVEPQRVYDSTFSSNRCVGLGYENLGGIESMRMRSFVGIMQALAGRQSAWPNLYNVRYVLQRQEPDEKAYRVLTNPDALPRAWLVGRSRRVAGDEAAWALLADPGFHPAEEVCLNQDLGLPGTPPHGAVHWLGRGPMGQLLDVSTDQASALLVSNSWYPSWRCQVDGQDRPVLEADGGLQAVALSPGRHLVAFHFDPGLFYDALAAALAGLVGLLGLGWMAARGHRSVQP